MLKVGVLLQDVPSMRFPLENRKEKYVLHHTVIDNAYNGLIQCEFKLDT